MVGVDTCRRYYPKLRFKIKCRCDRRSSFVHLLRIIQENRIALYNVVVRLRLHDHSCGLELEVIVVTQGISKLNSK